MRLAARYFLFACAGLGAVASEPTTEQTEFFESKIRPILVDHCYSCHSEKSEKVKGGLKLDTREATLKGGTTGTALVPGDPEASWLIKAVRYTDPDLQMPPKDKKLSAEQIAALEAWVKMGAPDPRVDKGPKPLTDIAEARARHWAFQPVTKPATPRVKNSRWVKTPVDNFVLAKLEAQKLKPAPAADRRTLIRRVSYDLLGLPPTLQEVEAFAKDKSPDAYAKLVDRLLASPQYGERWARHWLDVARYADTKGYLAGGEERRYPFSFTYRDWVVRAFNEDKPYDQFIMEQLAADRLPLGEDKSSLAALGFLTLGRRFLNNQNDIIDDRIDLVTRGTMGLTVACARCHDHKFDPVPMRDYYALHGVFASSEEPGEKPLLGPLRDSPEYQDYLKKIKEIEAEMEDFKDKEVAKFIAGFRENVGDYLLGARDVKALADRSKFDTFAGERKLNPTVLRRWIKDLDERGKKADPIFAPWFQLTALTETNFAAEASALLAKFSAEPVNFNPAVAKSLASHVTNSLQQAATALNELFKSVDKDWKAALEAANKENKPAPTALPDAPREALRQILYAEGTPINLPKDEARSLHARRLGEGSAPFRNRIEALNWTHNGAPRRAMAMADRANPANSRVFLRGNPGNPGPDAPRRFLEVLAGTNAPAFTNGSGRLELAQAITSRTNPLTARVFVNRVWRYHFGAGLVSTPGDFGVRTEVPLHRELLDYLAAAFMEGFPESRSPAIRASDLGGGLRSGTGVSPVQWRGRTDATPDRRDACPTTGFKGGGWSIKQLHRAILLSATYQQSCEASDATRIADPENHYFARMNRQRLDFEAQRDTWLAIAGRLDQTVGGVSVDIVSEPFSTRRTIYGLIDRQNLPGVFRTFDFANPDVSNQGRFTTTVPQQALFMMNNPFVIEQAKQLVQRDEVKRAVSETEKLQRLGRLVWLRPLEKDEVRAAEEFVKSQPKNEKLSPLEKYAQVLLLSNELLFVD